MGCATVNNPKFVESAPEDVVEETRANLALREAEDAQLERLWLIGRAWLGLQDGRATA